MKTNKLLYTLLGGALLASCSVDDGIGTNPVASVNPNSPVFTVSFDNGQETRAFWNDASVVWELEHKNDAGEVVRAADKSSLFHGIEDMMAGVSGYQNAIYSGIGDNGRYKLVTQSLVLPGYAIMVYPADTMFANTGTAAPCVSVPLTQYGEEYSDEAKTVWKADATKDLTPYMSGFIKIAGKDDMSVNKDSQTAGFGRDYNIAFRQIGSTLVVTLHLDGEISFDDNGVDDLIVKSMTIADKNNVNAPFTTKAPISAGTTKYDPAKPGYETLEYPSELDLSDACEAGKEIVTWDVEALKSDATGKTYNAYFTLLPAPNAFYTSTNPTASFTDDTEITISTNYGKITLSKTNKESNEMKLWWGGRKYSEYGVYKKQDASQGDIDAEKAEMMNIVEGLNHTFNALYLPKKDYKVYTGEKGGNGLQRHLNVPVSNIKMSGLHIEDEAHLIKIAKVISTLKPTGETIFYLDGKNGKFRIDTEAGRAAYKKIRHYGSDEGASAPTNATDNDTRITLVHCTGKPADEAKNPAEKCTEIVFGNKVGTDLANLSEGTTAVDAIEELGDLAFGAWSEETSQAYDDMTEAEKANEKVNVTFEGLWTLTDKMSTTNVNEVTNKGTLKVTAKEFKFENASKITNNGTINATADDGSNANYLGTDMENNGTLEIKTNGAKFYVRNGVTLNNNCLTGAVTIGANDEALKANRGVITVADNAELAAVTGANVGEINNYGYIGVSAGSVVKLASNQKVTNKFDVTKELTLTEKAENVLGIVNCGDNKLSTRSIIGKAAATKDGKSEGIVMSTRLENVSPKGVNYVKLAATSDEIVDNKVTLAVTYTDEDEAEKTAKVPYLEVTGTMKKDINIDGECDVLILNAKGTLYVAKKTTLKVNEGICILNAAGYVSYAGNFGTEGSGKYNIPAEAAYFGSVEKLEDHISPEQ